ncbi:hypothetical protein HFO43_09510 [Rhizobium leguminosarum]|uniref:hypothetical protein n=1 Tax=Rhizobium leguminosarum TaxID=384 RepID=UPI001C96A158|nr:hypothetical protein [Rhizobium leguminosarum]MBY5668781.1 hypothetical protein [Rhizobium leguminosarum]
MNSNDDSENVSAAPIATRLTSEAKLCKYCQKSMPLKATKCVECDSWQNWRGALNFSVPILSLLLALATVVFSSGREFYNSVFYSPKTYLLLSKLDINNSRDTWAPGDLNVVIVNNEDEDIVVNSGLECNAENIEKRNGILLFRLVRFYADPNADPGSARVEPSSFIIKANTQEAAKFSDVYWEGDVKAVIPSSTTGVQITCRLNYFFGGKQFVMRREDTPFIWVPPLPDPFDKSS